MNIRTVASLMLIGHILSAFFMVLVIKRQRVLSKLPVEPGLLSFRRTLSYLSIAILIGNFVPILIDIVTLASSNNLNRNPSTIGVVYAYSNVLTAIISAYLIWTLYKQAAKTVLIVDQATEDALNIKK